MKTLLLLLIATTLYGQPDFNAVISSIKEGNSDKVGTFMDKNVEMSVGDIDGSYSKGEAISILNSFLDTHIPSHCSLVHSGGTKDGASYYCIGNLSTKGEKYRVYLFFKRIGASYLIQEMRLELE